MLWKKHNPPSSICDCSGKLHQPRKATATVTIILHTFSQHIHIHILNVYVTPACWSSEMVYWHNLLLCQAVRSNSQVPLHLLRYAPSASFALLRCRHVVCCWSCSEISCKTTPANSKSLVWMIQLASFRRTTIIHCFGAASACLELVSLWRICYCWYQLIHPKFRQLAYYRVTWYCCLC